jgi:hypothetical protein
MKRIWLALMLILVLAGLVALVGAGLPVRHHATRKAHLRVSPAALYAVIAGPPDWRSGVKHFGALPDNGNRRQWWEEDSNRQKISYEVVEEIPARKLVVRIADRNLPFGGTWSYDIAPGADGGSELRISEDGEIYNVIYRFVSCFFLGYTGSIEGYFRDLGAKFGQTVKVEA